MTNNPKEKLFSNKFIQNFVENESSVTLKNKYKFAEIASSLAYYLKSFSNVNKLLDYICLIYKHIFKEKIVLIIPLNYEGEIWNENIKISASDECLKLKEEIIIFLNKFNFSKNFKLKEILSFEDALKKNFKEYKIESDKFLSRGKCRGFIYIFSKNLSGDSIIEDTNYKFIENCLAVGLENYFLIKKTKKHENVDREISTGAEIQSQLLPDFCPIIHGVDLAAHCRPALQLGGDYYDFMCLKTNISEKRREKARWALVIGDVMLDRYVIGEVNRISPEAPVPVISVNQEKTVAGGAANVALNAASLGATVEVCGWFGKDFKGRNGETCD